ncbi:kinetochore protein Nuf2 [Nematocida sp. LUAm3]|nr:kinetochore protein Nuf2 [Nematocida sp. LUAm3]KAI5175944.1 kinetochore protein Nuf2 [Nematocida sp. LUAm2]KAI5178674.1 kinetochore protein Nuf2 [Nematocida sp. LUAm1]
MKAQAPTYVIPNMSVKEIVEYLTENGFNMVDTDIHLPNTQYLCKLYEGILSVFAEEKVYESGEESMAIVQVYVGMRKFLERIGFGLFQMKDLIQPEASRVIKILSTVINFSLFKESKRHVYNRVYRKREEIEEKIEEYQISIEEKSRILHKKRKENEETKSILADLRGSLEVKEKEIINYHRDQQGTLREIEEIKKEHSLVLERVNYEKCQLIEVTQEISKLQAKIVRNPEQLKEILIGMKMQLKNEKEILREYEKKIMHLHGSTQNFKSVAEQLKSLLCTSSLLLEYRRKTEESESELKRLLVENENKEIENKSKSSEKSLLDKKILYVIDKMSALNSENEERLGTARKEFDALREKYAVVIREREETQKIIQIHNEEIKALEKEIIHLEAAYESQLLSILTDLSNKKGYLHGYTEDLEKLFKGEYTAQHIT